MSEAHHISDIAKNLSYINEWKQAERFDFDIGLDTGGFIKAPTA